MRTLTSRTSLDNLKREAKRWHKAVLAGNADGTDRLARVLPHVPSQPTLRDVQHALAREFGVSGWADLKRALADGMTPRDTALRNLLEAAATANASQIVEVLDRYPDLVSERGVRAGNNGLRSALHLAVGTGRVDIVALLLERGADPNVRDEGDNAYALHFAAEREILPIITLLVEHGAEMIGTGDDHDLEVIGWATVFGSARPDVVSYLLAHGARHNMLSAVATGDVAAIRQHAADRDRKMDRANLGRRPLHLAVIKKQPASLAALLELGADTELADDAGLTPLDQAALNNEDAMVGRLLDHGAQLRLPAAIALRRNEDVARLLAEEPDALKQGGRLASLIVRAAERSPGRTIRTLIRAGASAQATDDMKTSVDSARGYSALHAAAFFGNGEAVSVLLEHGASVRARDSKYCGTPAGWANYAGHTEVRDFINARGIDLFEMVGFNLAYRIAGAVELEPDSVDRRFGTYLDFPGNGWIDPSFTPLMLAASQGNLAACRALLDAGADSTLRDAAGRSVSDLADNDHREAIAAMIRARRPDSEIDGDRRADQFLRAACLDWRVGGSDRLRQRSEAGRMLAYHPEVARRDIHAAVAVGDVDRVRDLLHADPSLATKAGGPRGWVPLLYLCSARLPIAAASDNAVEIARLLLDGGADAGSYYFGGNTAIHYTALTCVMGRGEEQALMHPEAPALAALLLDRGADPFDPQLLYNVFANHASRNRLSNDITWYFDLIHKVSVRAGRASAWADPNWEMLDVGGYGPGAYYLLCAVIDTNLLALAEWMLAHGADPNTRPKDAAREPIIDHARKHGTSAMVELLVRYGATLPATQPEPVDVLTDQALAGDVHGARASVAAHPELLANHRPMFRAAELNNGAAVDLLVELGMSPDVDDPASGGRRAIHVAAWLGSVDVARVLIAHGADVDFHETGWNTIPLEAAAFGQQQPMIELLGQHSRNLWELVYTGRVDRVRELLAENPQLGTLRNAGGETPLMWLPADEESAVEITKMMLMNGADAAAVDSKGRTARDIAIQRSMPKVAELLRR